MTETKYFDHNWRAAFWNTFLRTQRVSVTVTYHTMFDHFVALELKELSRGKRWRKMKKKKKNIVMENLWWRWRWRKHTLREVSKYGVFTGPYFPVFGLNKEFYSVNLSVFILNTGKYGPEKTPYLDIFHVMIYMDRENEFIKNDKKKSSKCITQNQEEQKN